MITRRTSLAAFVATIAIVASLATLVPAAGASSTPISLLLPQSTAFGFLGHSCGGIQEQAFATGFDANTGYPAGDVYLQTRCGGSGRGGGYHVTTYSTWVDVAWDFTGAVATATELAAAPTVDPSFSAVDANGNQLSNSASHAYLTLSDSFVPAPRVTTISLGAGPASGGTSVTITGTGFTGATEVNFGATAAASFTVASDTSIVAISPPALAGTVDVTVANAGGASATSAADLFTFVGRPAVADVNPASGPVTGGTEVTISGTGLSAATGVSFGEDPAGFYVVDDGSIVAYSPAAEAADTVPVTVTSLGGTSAATPASRFDYVAIPPLTCTARFGDNFLPALQGTAAFFGIAPADLPEYGVAFLAFLLGPDPGTGPAIAPPDNTGPNTYSHTYTAPTDIALVQSTAGYLQLSCDDTHYIGAYFLMFVWLSLGSPA